MTSQSSNQTKRTPGAKIRPPVKRPTLAEIPAAKEPQVTDEPASESEEQVVAETNDSPEAVDLSLVLRKKELLDLVVARSGQKKRDVKPVVETMLAVLGEALADDREFNLRPFGQLKIRNARDTNNGRIIVARIRQPLFQGRTKDETDTGSDTE